MSNMSNISDITMSNLGSPFSSPRYSPLPTSPSNSSRTSSTGYDFNNNQTVEQTAPLLGSSRASSGSKSFGSYQQSQNLGQKLRTTEPNEVVTVMQGQNGTLSLNKEIELTDADRAAGIVGYTVTLNPILNVSDEASVNSSLSGNASINSIRSVTVSIRNQQGQQQDIIIPVINGVPQQTNENQNQGVWANLNNFINRWVSGWNLGRKRSDYSTDSSRGGRRRRSRRYKSRRYTKKRHYRKHRNTRRRPRRNTKKRGRK
jgi:hypothetical protein